MGLLRLLLAASVLFAHVAKPNWYTGLGGELAVESFFLISGFYMSRILTTTYSSKRKFYLNRALRILPIYYLVLIATIIQLELFAKVGIGASFNWPSTRSEFLAFLPNISIFGSDWIQFFNSTYEGLIHVGTTGGVGSASKFLLIAPAWTLGLEFTFYLFAPFIVRLSKPHLLLVVVFFFTLRIICWTFGYSQDPWSYRFIIFELPVFFLGVLAEKVKASGQIHFEFSNRTIYLSVATFYIVVGLTIQNTSVDYAYLLTLTMLFTLFVLLLSRNSDRDRKIGELSYPLYLCHILTISSAAAILDKFGFFNLSYSRGSFEILVLVLSILVARVLLGMTSPVEGLRDRIRGD